MRILTLVSLFLIFTTAYANGGGGLVGKSESGVYFSIALDDCKWKHSNPPDSICIIDEINVQDARQKVTESNAKTLNKSIKVNCSIKNEKNEFFSSIECQSTGEGINKVGISNYIPLSNTSYSINRSLMSKDGSNEEILSCRRGCNKNVPFKFKIWWPED